MKLDNQTHWRSDQIRALALRVAQDELDPPARKRFVVRVRYGHRGPATSGHAHYHSTSCQVNVGSDVVDPVSLAHTLAHEMAHTRGVRHSHMRGARRYVYADGWRDYYAWAHTFPIERLTAPPRPTTDERRAARLERAQRTLALWERKHRLAATKIRRWKQRVRTLERTLTRAAQTPMLAKTMDKDSA